MAMWNPWRGCHKHSEGCRYCYIHKGDFKRGIDTNNIVKTDNFYAPIAKNKRKEKELLWDMQIMNSASGIPVSV